MVIAGPGTGKTRVLTTRIAKILETTDTKPHNILALTFTDSASSEMRRRLVEMIGSTGYYVRIETFHAFCSQVIREHPEYFPVDRGSSPLTALEKFAIFEEIILSADLEAIKPLSKPLNYLQDCISQISNLKKEGFSPADFSKLLEKEARELEAQTPDLKKTELTKRQNNLAKQQELLEVYKLYQQKIRESLRYDFDDMIILVKEAFASEEMLLREYQEEIHYFLVDEYQDTNASQNTVVDLLASWWGDNANLFVVGDPHQSIYRFQGASMENMLGFIDRHPKALIINLDVGYRCTQEIYDTAHHLIQHNQLTKIDKSLASAVNQRLQSGHQAKYQGDFQDESRDKQAKFGVESQQNPHKIKLYQAPSQVVELVAVANQVQGLINSGTDPEEIAILYRRNADSAMIAQTLDHFGIKYEIEGGGNILESEKLNQLLTLLRVIDQLKRGEDADELFEVLCYEWTAPSPHLALRVARSASKARLPIIDLILSGYETFAKHHIGDEVSREEFATLQDFAEYLFMWGIIDAQMVFPEWFEVVLDQSGYLDWVLQSEAKVEVVSELNSLYSQIKSLAKSQKNFNLSAFNHSLELMDKHHISIDAEDLNITSGAVKLSTAHKAKGQEWQHVFIVHCQDKRWGNTYERKLLPLPESILEHSRLDKKEKNEDERRLFYVAITRAKEQVYISYPQTVIEGDHSKETVASMFLSEIKDYLDTFPDETIKAIEADPIDAVARLLRPPAKLKISHPDRDYFKILVDNMTLAPTTLNTYLKDPQEFILKSLLKVPRAKAEHMAFGTAIHTALEYLFGQIIKNQDKPELETVWQVYERALERELLVSLDFNRRLKYGRKVLENYWQQLDSNFVQPLFLERQFGFGISKTMLGDITLTGKADRVDWVDKSKKTVRIIDYKTGIHKRINEIKGITAVSKLSQRERELPEGIRGPYQRQLVFYKLLSELDNSFMPEVVEAGFEFVEPEKGKDKINKVSLIITEEDVANLKKLIKEVMSEIRSLEFLDLLPPGVFD